MVLFCYASCLAFLVDFVFNGLVCLCSLESESLSVLWPFWICNVRFFRLFSYYYVFVNLLLLVNHLFWFVISGIRRGY